MAAFRILALGGDGIGPEVLAAGLRVAHAAAEKSRFELTVEEDLLHGAAWDAYGTFCREETVALAQVVDAVVVGAVGGPKWDHISVPGGPEMQDGLMRLRKELDTYAGLRPAVFHGPLANRTPFGEGRAAGADIMILREMCGGVMFAEPRGLEEGQDGRYAFDTAGYHEKEIRRIAHAGFRLARARRGSLVSADKANVMESYKLWRAVFEDVATAYPDVQFSHFFADNCAYQMMMAPTRFDVVVGCNLLGDLLSDLAAVVSGGLGMLPSACLAGAPYSGKSRIKGIYEPVHGSAPDIAGQGKANPVGMILSIAMMFEHGARRPEAARLIKEAVDEALADGVRTGDIGGSDDTDTVTEAVIARLKEPAS